MGSFSNSFPSFFSMIGRLERVIVLAIYIYIAGTHIPEQFCAQLSLYLASKTLGKIIDQINYIGMLVVYPVLLFIIFYLLLESRRESAEGRPLLYLLQFLFSTPWSFGVRLPKWEIINKIKLKINWALASS